MMSGSPKDLILGKGGNRQKHYKTRTGCLTCKRRRVKCDEAKPKCNRCLNVGVECDGYPKFHQDMRPRPLLPLQIPGNLSVAPFSGIQCQNEFEFKHFQHFQNEIALDLSGALDKLNWNRIIISGCRLEPHVLTAVVAISALSVSRKLNREAKDEASRANAIRYRQLALKHHEKSLQVMRETLGKRPDVRSALGACLMVCFFECLSGNLLTTISHLRSGQKLFQEYSKDSGSDCDPQTLRNNLPEMMVQEAGVFFNTHMEGMSDSIPAESNRLSRNIGEEEIERMPKAFFNIDDVRYYWRLIDSRGNHFLRKISNLQRGQSTLSESDAEAAAISEQDTGSTPGPQIGSSTLSDSLKTFQDEKEKYAQEHMRWRLAFKPLYKNIIASSDKAAAISAHTLFVRCKTSEMNLVSSLDTDNCSFDKYLADFREIVSTCRNIIQMKKSIYDDDFTFNLGVIPAPHTVGKWCRDRILRREAIALQRWYAYREGTWDSITMVNLDTWLMGLEEDGIETDYIPKHARIGSFKVEIDSSERAVVMKFIRGPRVEGNNQRETVYMRLPENKENSYWT